MSDLPKRVVWSYPPNRLWLEVATGMEWADSHGWVGYVSPCHRAWVWVDEKTDTPLCIECNGALPEAYKASYDQDQALTASFAVVDHERNTR